MRFGISQADLYVLSGRAAFTGLLGQEFVGVVESVNPDRPGQEVWVGKRVVASPVVSCGSCPTCRSGLAGHCPTRQVVGIHGRPGVLADRCTAPIRNLVELPKAVSDDAAVFAYPLAHALIGPQAIRLEGKPFVTILGDDVRALLAAQVMARRNASVRLLGDHPDRFTLCERWGIKHRAAAEVGRRQDQDVVFECTGTPAGLELALRLVRPRGTVALLSAPPGVPGQALTPHPAPLDLTMLSANEVRLIGAGAASLAEAVRALADNTVDVTRLTERKFRLSEVQHALDAAGQPSALKVVLEP